MRVAIDGGPLSSGDSVRGIGVYVRELTKVIKDADIIDVKKADLSRYDVVHFTKFNPFFVSLPFSKPDRTKFVLTIYDLIPLIYPKHYVPGIKGFLKWQVNKYLIKKNVDAIVTISETSKKDICRFLEIDPNKVFVTYLASPAIFKRLESGNKQTSSTWKSETAKKFNLPKQFVLYVGDINYSKNIPNLVKACGIVGLPLVVAGKQAAEVDKMDMKHPEHIHLRSVDWSNVVRLGFVEDSDLVKIYNLAEVYAQPSFYEGFSLPPLQAVNCKTPVVLSKNQCHVEVFGDDFDYIDPNDPKSIADGILNPNRSKKLPRNYTWQKTALDTSEIYEKVRN